VDSPSVSSDLLPLHFTVVDRPPLFESTSFDDCLSSPRIYPYGPSFLGKPSGWAWRRCAQYPDPFEAGQVNLLLRVSLHVVFEQKATLRFWSSASLRKALLCGGRVFPSFRRPIIYSIDRLVPFFSSTTKILVRSLYLRCSSFLSSPLFGMVLLGPSRR